jgi:hypothetical protein
MKLAAEEATRHIETIILAGTNVGSTLILAGVGNSIGIE